jgi:hypothetical protein
LAVFIFRRSRFDRGFPAVTQNEIDFSRLETGQLHLKPDVDQTLQFDSQNFPVPAGLESNLVVRDDVSAAF